MEKQSCCTVLYIQRWPLTEQLSWEKKTSYHVPSLEFTRPEMKRPHHNQQIIILRRENDKEK